MLTFQHGTYHSMQCPCFLKRNSHQGLLLTDRGTSWPHNIWQSYHSSPSWSFEVLDLCGCNCKRFFKKAAATALEMRKKEEPIRTMPWRTKASWTRWSVAFDQMFLCLHPGSSTMHLNWGGSTSDSERFWKYRLHHHTFPCLNIPSYFSSAFSILCIWCWDQANTQSC